MNAYTRSEMFVGFFVVIGGLALAYLSVSIAGLKPSSEGTLLTAKFSSVGSLKPGDPVKIAGVTIGAVEKVSLVDFEAQTALRITQDVKLPSDSIASIESAGLLGDAYVSVSPGAADDDLKNGGHITRTEPAVSITNLIAKYAFGSPTDESDSRSSAPDPKPTPDTGAAASASGSSAPEKKSPFKDPFE